MTGIEYPDTTVSIADWRAQSICGMTCQELSEQLACFDSYLPEEIKEAAVCANDRDNVAAVLVDGYRTAVDAKGVHSRRRVRQQLEVAEHAIAIGGPLHPDQVERLGRLVQAVVAGRDEAVRVLDEHLHLAQRILAEGR